MRKLFSTHHAQAHRRFQEWRDVCEDRLVPMVQHRLDDDQFDASIDGTNIGALEFTKFTLSDLKAVTTPATIRHPENKTDKLFISLIQFGKVYSEQNGQSIKGEAGHISIRDTNSPWTIEHRGDTDVLAIGIPRDRLENLLGSARNYAGLTVADDLPTAALARTFLTKLVDVGNQLTPAAAEQMAGIGIDLVVASIAERMAQEAPKALQGTVIVQRAKAYIEANLHDPTLDPPQLAVAVGVSVRRLQQLFHERGRHISDWIWKQRLEKAARWLADPGLLHLPLGTVSYSCGFASQSHFSRRFRDRYGVSPSDYRRQILLEASTQTGMR